MQNEGTNDTLLTNKTTTGASLTLQEANDTVLVNAVTVTNPVDNIVASDSRFEGLWVRLVQPWELTEIWSYESIIKNNTVVTNL